MKVLLCGLFALCLGLLPSSARAEFRAGVQVGRAFAGVSFGPRFAPPSNFAYTRFDRGFSQARFGQGGYFLQTHDHSFVNVPFRQFNPGYNYRQAQFFNYGSQLSYQQQIPVPVAIPVPVPVQVPLDPAPQPYGDSGCGAASTYSGTRVFQLGSGSYGQQRFRYGAGSCR